MSMLHKGLEARKLHECFARDRSYIICPQTSEHNSQKELAIMCSYAQSVANIGALMLMKCRCLRPFQPGWKGWGLAKTRTPESKKFICRWLLYALWSSSLLGPCLPTSINGCSRMHKQFPTIHFDDTSAASNSWTTSRPQKRADQRFQQTSKEGLSSEEAV